MKNKGLIFRIIIGAFVAAILVVCALLFSNNTLFNKSFAYEVDAIKNIAEFVDETNENASSASFVLQNIDEKNLELLEGHKYRVSCEDESLTLSILDAKTNDELEYQNNIITMNNNGITVKVDGLTKGNTYNIKIEPVSSKKGYRSPFNEAIINLDYTEVLTASISSIKDNENNLVELNDNDRIVFLYTDEDDKIRLRANQDVDIEYYYSVSQLSDEELKNVTFSTYDKTTYLKVTTNGYLYAKARYKTEAFSKVSVLHITNVDRLAPVVGDSVVTLNENHTVATVTYSFDDHEATDEDGKSGVLQYAFSESHQLSNDDEAWITAEAGEYSNQVEENGNYYIHVKDKAGNFVTKQVTVTGIEDAPQEGYFVLILESSNPDLVGRYYNSLKEMKDDFDTLNLTNEDTVLAQIEGDIQNQRLDIENVNLTIDLNGYTLQSKNTNPTFNIKNGSNLKIVDNKYAITDYLEDTQIDATISTFANGTGYGKVTNIRADAIVINQGGVLQLGEDNSPDLAHIEHPDHNAPYIQGLRKGIYNKGTFKYYDGVLYGGIAIDGDINDTPPLYDPSVVQDDETGDFKITLDIVSGIEALIGKTRYTLLEQAVEAANDLIGDSDTQVEIDIITNIAKQDTIVIPDNKNIILDLNGNSFESASSSPILSNYGKLQLKDSGETGIIKCTGQTDCIINNNHAELTINSGSYQGYGSSSSVLKRYCAVFNNRGKLTVNGGKYNQTNATTSSYIFYNSGGEAVFNNNTDFDATTIMNSDYYDEETVEYEEILDLSKFKLNPNYGGANYPTFTYTDGKLYGNTTPSYQAFTSMEFDLTEYSKFTTFEIEMNVYGAVSENNYFYAHMNTNNQPSGELAVDNRVLFMTNTTGYNTSKLRFNGGQKYYLVITFTRGAYSSSDIARVDEIKFRRFKTTAGQITINDGVYEAITSDSVNGSITINNGTFNKGLAPRNENVLINDGVFNGVVSVNADSLIAGGTFNNNVNCTSKDVTLNISGGTFNSNVTTTYGSAAAYTTLNITGGTFNSITSTGKLYLKNSTIYGTIHFLSEKELLIDNCTFDYDDIKITNFYAVHNLEKPFILINNTSQAVIKNSTFNINVPLSIMHGSQYIATIGKTGSGDLILNGVTMNANISSYAEFRGPTGSNYVPTVGTYSNVVFDEGDLYIDNSNISISTADTWNDNEVKCVLNRGNGSIIIGNNDGVYESDRVSISSNTIALANHKSRIYYYDGKIVQKLEEFNDTITEFENGYTINKTFENNMYITTQQPKQRDNIYNVNKNKYYEFLNDAITEADSNDKLRLNNDLIYDTNSQLYTIDINKSLTIDLNGKTIYLGNDILNNGNLTFIDDSDTQANVYLNGIINNNQLNILSGKWIFRTSNSNGILNNGNLLYKDSSVETGELRDFEIIIYNNGILTTDNLHINLKNYIVSAIYNNKTGKAYINNSSIESTLAQSFGYDTENSVDQGHSITNSGGYLELNNSEIDSETLYYGREIYNDGKNKDLVDLTPDSSYRGTFEIDEYGELTSYHSGCGYIPIDLTDYPGDVEVELVYSLTGAGSLNNSPVSIYFSESTEKITGKPVNGSFARLSEKTTDALTKDRYTGTVEGGKQYYFHVYGSGSKASYSQYIYFRLFEINIKYNNETWDALKSGNMIIDGGRIGEATSNISNSTVYMNLVENTRSFLTMKNNRFDGSNSSKFYSKSGGITTMENVTFDSSKPSISLARFSKLNADNLTMNSSFPSSHYDYKNYYTVVSLEYSDADFSNINFNKGFAIKYSNLNIHSGSIVSTLYGINADNSNVVIGQREQSENAPVVSIQADYCGLYAKNESNIELSNSNITAVGTNNSSRAIHMDGSNTTLTISNENDNNAVVSTTSPLISGVSYGIYNNSGTINYYDGIIKGSTALYGGIAKRPDDYELKTETIDGIENMTLFKYEVVSNEAKEKTYPSLESAFNDCDNNTNCNLKLLMDISLAKSQILQSNKIVNLDLNNKSIHSVADNNLYNYGNLTLTNGKVDIVSTTNFESAIHNYGTLTINSDLSLNNNGNIESVLIKNHDSGTLYVNGSTVTGTYSSYTQCKNARVIANEGGYAVIDGGTYTVQGAYDGNYGTSPSCMGGTIASSKSIPEFKATRGTYVGGGNGEITARYNSAAYIVIDLTNYVTDVTLKIGYIAAYNKNQGTSVHLTTTEDVPLYSNANNRLLILSNNQSAATTTRGTLTTTVAGGRVYYLHIQAANYSSDLVTINDISMTSGGETKNLFNPAHTVIKNITLDYTGDGIAISNSDSKLEIDNVSMVGHYDRYGKVNSGVALYKNSEATINGLTLRDFGYGIHVNDSTKVNISNYTTSINSNDTVTVAKTHSGIYSTGGEITVDNSNISGPTAAIYVDGTTELSVDSSNLNSKTGVYINNGTNTINLGKNGEITTPNTITATTQGLYLKGTNKINIGNTNITSNQYGIYQLANNRSEIVLSDNSNSVSNTIPYIKGTEYGIYNSGVFKFYDGKLEGTTALLGGVSDKPEDYEVEISKTNGVEIATLSNDDVAYNVNTGLNYKDLTKAINACPNDTECTIQMLHDINFTRQLEIKYGSNLILDMQEHKIAITQSDTLNNIINNGILTIKNGIIDAQGIADMNSLIDNYGKLTTIELTMNQNDNIYCRLITNNSFADLNIKSGVYNALASYPAKNNYRYGSIIYNLGGNVVIDGGEFNSNSRPSSMTSSYGPTYAIFNTNGVPKGDLYDRRNSSSTVISILQARSDKVIEIDTTRYTGDVQVALNYNCTYKNVYMWVQNDTSTTYTPTEDEKIPVTYTNSGGRADSTFTVAGGAKYYLRASNYVSIYDIKLIQNDEEVSLITRGSMIINDMTLTEKGNDYIIYNTTSDFEMNGGTLKYYQESKGGYGIYLYKSKATITGGTIKWLATPITSTDNTELTVNNINIENSTTGLNITNGTATINNCNISATSHGINAGNTAVVYLYGGVINSSGYGLYISYTNTVFHIGKNDGVVSVTKPHITSTNQGIYVYSANYNPTINYYDGIFTTSNTLTNGNITEIPENYQILNSGNDYYLGIEAIIENTYKYNGMYFQNINMPINMISELDNKVGTIELGNDVVLTQPINIPGNVSITLALHGHSIQFADGVEQGIINNGTLNIIDGSGDDVDENTLSWVINENGTVIQNNGTLVIGSSTNLNRQSPKIKGKYGITGNGGTIVSGSVESTATGNILNSVGNALMNLFSLNIQPSYSYKTADYQVSKISNDVILATSPTFRTVQDLNGWYNTGIDIGMTSHNVGLLNVVSDRNPDDTKEIEYTIEVYKNGVLDEFYTYRKVVSVQYLEDNTLDVDLDWFDDVKTKFKNYYLTKMTINDHETNEVPTIVDDGTTIKVFYGQVQGEEIEIVNPKTGRKSYKLAFIIALISSLLIAFIVINRETKTKVKAN